MKSDKEPSIEGSVTEVTRDGEKRYWHLFTGIDRKGAIGGTVVNPIFAMATIEDSPFSEPPEGAMEEELGVELTHVATFTYPPSKEDKNMYTPDAYK